MKLGALLIALFAASLACRPVLTIGWGEILIVVALILLLIGPLLFRLYRKWLQYKVWKDSDKR